MPSVLILGPVQTTTTTVILMLDFCLCGFTPVNVMGRFLDTLLLRIEFKDDNYLSATALKEPARSPQATSSLDTACPFPDEFTPKDGRAATDDGAGTTCRLVDQFVDPLRWKGSTDRTWGKMGNI